VTTSTCQRCLATWTGLKGQHCKSCHATFTGTDAGDRHRTGHHAVTEGPERRRCLTPDEMRDKGLSQNAKGLWGRSQALDVDALARITGRDSTRRSNAGTTTTKLSNQYAKVS
jgi:hypothetical protein